MGSALDEEVGKGGPGKASGRGLCGTSQGDHVRGSDHCPYEILAQSRFQPDRPHLNGKIERDEMRCKHCGIGLGKSHSGRCTFARGFYTSSNPGIVTEGECNQADQAEETELEEAHSFIYDLSREFARISDCSLNGQITTWAQDACKRIGEYLTKE